MANTRWPGRNLSITPRPRLQCDGPRHGFVRLSLLQSIHEGMHMKSLRAVYREQFGRQRQKGGIGWVVLWLLGVPIPVLIILFLLRGCT